MSSRPPQSDKPIWIKILSHDLFAVLIMGAVALCGGLIVNQFRDNRLPLIYSPKAERIDKAVVKLGGLVATANGLDSKSSSPSVTVDYLDLPELRKLVGGKTKAILLDARPEVFHRMGHIPGAISLSREKFEADYAKQRALLESDKSQFIVVYCSDADCEDSQMVADALVKLGFPRVFVFKGGWDAWTEAHLPEGKAP